MYTFHFWAKMGLKWLKASFLIYSLNGPSLGRWSSTLQYCWHRIPFKTARPNILICYLLQGNPAPIFRLFLKRPSLFWKSAVKFPFSFFSSSVLFTLPWTVLVCWNIISTTRIMYHVVIKILLINHHHHHHHHHHHYATLFFHYTWNPSYLLHPPCLRLFRYQSRLPRQRLFPRHS